MARDLLIITPSRGRPDRLWEMLDAVFATAEASTHVAVALDEDDAASYVLLKAAYGADRRVLWRQGARRTLAGWTNALAAMCGGGYRAFASLGDDHVPRTQGWDRLLLDAIDRMGGTGIAFGDDGIMHERLPTAPVISANIVHALGWMCEPSLRHMFVDNVWGDLGREAGRLAYVPEVVIEHVHWSAGKVAPDQVYAETEAQKEPDRALYEKWKAERMAADAAKVRALCSKEAALCR